MPEIQNTTPTPDFQSMMGGAPDAAMGMPTGPVPEDSVIGEPESAPAPEEASAPTGGTKTDGLKRQLLQKMMENLLNKPGRSVNELVNGVKSVIGAYKNYAKEWDNLSGIQEAPLSPAGSSAEGGSEIQDILNKIREQKGMPAPGGSSEMPPQPPIGQ
jgi:hypothetical protein